MRDTRPIILFLATATLMQGCGRATPGNGAGTAAPAAATVEFADIDRVRAALAALKGRPVFLNFWATWCAPCMEELPDLAALAREAGGTNAAFLGISLDTWVTGEGAETGDKVRKALAAAGVSYPNLVYTGDQDPLLEGFRLPGSIPYSILYDSEGRDVKRFDEQVEIEAVRRAIAAETRKAAGAPPPVEPAASR